MAAFCAQARTMTLAQCQQTALETNETMTVSANKLLQAKLDVENAVLERERNTRLMTIEVNSNIRNVVDSRRMIETAELGVEQANENLKVMRSLFDNGMATLTDLLDAQSQWHSARSNLIEARMQFKSYETDYLRSVGKLRTESK
ncbi:MAG: TolC family protein [Muribaculaceae bacterium]|nr:TolC family protein [Muribaculaceae bacterium]